MDVSPERPAEDLLDEVRGMLRTWLSQQGQSRCWYYPDLFREMCALLGVQPEEVPALREQAAQAETPIAVEYRGPRCHRCASYAYWMQNLWVCQGCGYSWEAAQDCG